MLAAKATSDDCPDARVIVISFLNWRSLSSSTIVFKYVEPVLVTLKQYTIGVFSTFWTNSTAVGHESPLSVPMYTVFMIEI